MNIKALITTFVLGSSTVAVAEPSFSASAGASWSWGTPSVSSRDHRRPLAYDDRNDGSYTGGWAPASRPERWSDADRCENPRTSRVSSTLSEYTGPIMSMPRGRRYGYRRPGWFAVTEPTRIDNGRHFIYPQAAGRLDRLMIRQVAGSSMIYQIAIGFTNGETQVLRGVNQALDRRHQSFAFDLDGNRQVARVVLYGATAPNSALQLLAM